LLTVRQRGNAVDKEQTLYNLRQHLKSSNAELRKAVQAEIDDIENGGPGFSEPIITMPLAADDWRKKAAARLKNARL
jgi:hypothetical protein